MADRGRSWSSRRTRPRDACEPRSCAREAGTPDRTARACRQTRSIRGRPGHAPLRPGAAPMAAALRAMPTTISSWKAVLCAAPGRSPPPRMAADRGHGRARRAPPVQLEEEQHVGEFAVGVALGPVVALLGIETSQAMRPRRCGRCRGGDDERAHFVFANIGSSKTFGAKQPTWLTPNCTSSSVCIRRTHHAGIVDERVDARPFAASSAAARRCRDPLIERQEGQVGARCRAGRSERWPPRPSPCPAGEHTRARRAASTRATSKPMPVLAPVTMKHSCRTGRRHPVSVNPRSLPASSYRVVEGKTAFDDCGW